MEFGLKALQFLNAKTEQNIESMFHFGRNQALRYRRCNHIEYGRTIERKEVFRWFLHITFRLLLGR